MANEWYANCKDCGKKYGYSDTSHQLGKTHGLSRPERCPSCRGLHSREIASLGLSHFELTPVRPIPPEGLQAGELGSLMRPQRVHELREKKPNYDFDKFGIKDSHILEFYALSHRHQVMVVVAPTGAGKSTLLPYRLMIPPTGLPPEGSLFRSMLPAHGIRPDFFTRNGQIIVTQPRTQATRNIPAFVAGELHGSSLGAGYDVGFKHSGNPAYDRHSKLVYMTDGTLINMIVRNEIGRLGAIMIDEAHERSLNIDLILGLLKAQLKRYPHLKLIIASATINAQLFLNYYGGPADFDPDHYKTTIDGDDRYDNEEIAKKLSGSPIGFYGFPGKRQYPVTTNFRESNPLPFEQMVNLKPADEVANKVIDLLKKMDKGQEVPGDILAFLHGKKPIENAVKSIREHLEDSVDLRLARRVKVLPLYTTLPQPQQDAALKSKKNESLIRVVISTNVAETSLTVDGIVHVVDSGLINESQWDPQTQTSYVIPKTHSQSGCKQRWGRGGRVQAGVAHCLYTEEQFTQLFPSHTDPEIVRAPIEQIILTAKAAGVNDIKSFDWIQRPDEAELDRAPQFLRNMGALDADGDLTEHGIELSCTEDIDIANLMILADRFGCAVEMATLIPMRKLGGYSSLLLWDRSWDAPTKRAVRKIHQALIAPCQDDVEFCLKLWELWESKVKNERESWAQRYFVRHDVFQNKIVDEREKLLQSLSAHKKDDQARSIDFNLLTRLRIVITYGLSNQIYQWVNQSGHDETPKYRPYIHDPDANPELVKLHEGAEIDISPESICYGKLFDISFDIFVCGKRQRTRKRVSPFLEPVTYISAAFLTLIKSEWLQVIGQSPIAVARLIAAETRNADGVLYATTSRARLFIDQTYPLGATFSCRVAANGKIEIDSKIAESPSLLIGNNYEDIQDYDDSSEDLDSKGTLPEALGDGLVPTQFGQSEENPRKNDEDDDDDTENSENETPNPVDGNAVIPSEEQSSIDLALNRLNKFYGKIIDETNTISEGDEFQGIVQGFDFSEFQYPKILIEKPPEIAPFKKFMEIYKQGDDVEVEVTNVEQYVNDRQLYLIVREPESRLEIILDRYDAGLTGCDFDIEIFKSCPPGTRISITIEDIDDKACRVRATRLKWSQDASATFLGSNNVRTVDAKIVEVRYDGSNLFLWLDPENTKDYLPVLAYVGIGQLPPRSEEMSEGKTCRVCVKSFRFKKEKPVSERVEDQDINQIEQCLGVNWDNERKSLIAKSRIPYKRRLEMLNLSTNVNYRTKVNKLFRRSNKLDITIIDEIGLDKLRPYLADKKTLRAKVIKIQDDGLEVRTEDGYTAYIKKEETLYDQSFRLQEQISTGEEVDICVKNIDDKEGKAELTMVLPESDPIRNYFINQRTTGKVVGFKKSDTYVQLEPGVTGFVPITKVAVSRINNAREHLSIGNVVSVRITGLSWNNRSILLSICGLYELRFFTPAIYRRLININKIGKETSTKIELNKYFYSIQAPDKQAVIAAEKRISEILESKVVTFDLENFQMGLLIGKRGTTIKAIEANTGAKIDTAANGCEVTISATDNQMLKKTLDEIRKTVSHCCLSVQIDASKIPRIVGSGGKTIKKIKDDSGAKKIELGRDVNNDFTGQITIEAPSCSIAELACSLIDNCIGSGGLTVQHSNDYSLPSSADLQLQEYLKLVTIGTKLKTAFRLLESVLQKIDSYTITYLSIGLLTVLREVSRTMSREDMNNWMGALKEQIENATNMLDQRLQRIENTQTKQQKLADKLDGVLKTFEDRSNLASTAVGTMVDTSNVDTIISQQIKDINILLEESSIKETASNNKKILPSAIEQDSEIYIELTGEGIYTNFSASYSGSVVLSKKHLRAAATVEQLNQLSGTGIEIRLTNEEIIIHPLPNAPECFLNGDKLEDNAVNIIPAGYYKLEIAGIKLNLNISLIPV